MESDTIPFYVIYGITYNLEYYMASISTSLR